MFSCMNKKWASIVVCIMNVSCFKRGIKLKFCCFFRKNRDRGELCKLSRSLFRTIYFPTTPLRMKGMPSETFYCLFILDRI